MEELINEGNGDYFSFHKGFLLKLMHQFQVHLIKAVLRDIPSEIFLMRERASDFLDDFIMIFLEVKLPDIAPHKYIKRIH